MEYPETAIARLDDLIAREPENPELYVQRGLVWQDARKFDRAMADFDRALELDSFCVSALAARARQLYNLRDFDGAIADCTRALMVEPSDVAILCTRAASYLQKGEHERALEGFDRVLQLSPGQRGALQWRGIAKEALGDVPGAEKDFAMSKALKPPLEPE